MQIVTTENGLKKIKNSKLFLPFAGIQLDSPTALKIFAEKSIYVHSVEDNFGCLVMNLPELSETLVMWNNHKQELNNFLQGRMVISDPCSEVTYYAWAMNRRDYSRQNIHPKLQKILREANSKNYASIWLDEFENYSDLINFTEKTLEVQNSLTAAFPITPVLEVSSPNQLINLSFDINKESCSMSHTLEKEYLGCYVSLHGSIFSNDEKAKRKLSYISEKIVEILKKYNKVCLFVKLVDMENSSSHSYEKAVNVAGFIDALSHLKGTEYVNGNNFLLIVGGVTKKYTAIIGKGADACIELMNGKTTIFKPEAYNTKNRKKNFQFGDFYDMIDQIMISYDALISYWKTHKALPSYTESAKNVKPDELENHIRYARLKRVNQVEARCLEIEQIRKDIISKQERGLQDRLARSVDSELQQLAKLF